MPCSKHISGYKSGMLAIIFLFLNCVCIASPGIKNTTGNNNKQTASLQFGNELTTLGAEENQLTAYSFKHHPLRISASSRSHTCIENFYSNTTLLPVKNSISPITAPYFLTKPGYYTFLFRYTLF